MTAPADTGHVIVRTRRQGLALRLPLWGLFAAMLLSLALVLLFAGSMVAGSYDIDLPTLLATLAGETVSKSIDNVVWQFRMPRTLAAMLVGAMIASSGAALQNVTGNSLADPSLVGISQGAALAVVGAIVVFPATPPEMRPLLALVGALVVAGLIQGLSAGQRGPSPVRFILIGIGLSAFISSLTSAMMTYGDIDRVMSALAWLAGSVNAATWRDVSILAGWCVVLLPLLMLLSRAMAALRLGEATAIGLGAEVRAVRLGLVGIGVGLAAVATAVVGPIGFVGLVAPHAARRLAHTGAGLHLLLTTLCGALLVAAADLIGRAAFAPVQLPAGLLTALIGVPIFIVLLRRSSARTQS